MSTDQKNHQFATRAIHAGQDPDPTTGAVMFPIYQTSTYAQRSPGVNQGYEYSRTRNPTRTAYETLVASLEGGKHGLAFSSGVATITTIVHLLKSGDHVVCCDDVYGGTYRLFSRVFDQLGVKTTFVDLSDLAKTKAAFQPNTKMLWMESPTNPLLKVLDIEALCKIAKERNLISVVDNTFMSPYFQKPLTLGADIVMHSVTKYMNGHSDVIGGVLITNRDDLLPDLKYLQNTMGAVPGPMDCFLVMRGLKTLHVRMERHQENAMAIAKFLEAHPKVERVVYPGLESHPQHSIARKQASGFGGMITFFIKGDIGNARKFLENVKVFTLAESLGGVESLIEHPAIMTHASVPKAVRESVGIKDTLIRISVGIEAIEDLKADLEQALAKV